MSKLCSFGQSPNLDQQSFFFAWINKPKKFQLSNEKSFLLYNYIKNFKNLNHCSKIPNSNSVCESENKWKNNSCERLNIHKVKLLNRERQRFKLKKSIKNSKNKIMGRKKIKPTDDLEDLEEMDLTRLDMVRRFSFFIGGLSSAVTGAPKQRKEPTRCFLAFIISRSVSGSTEAAGCWPFDEFFDATPSAVGVYKIGQRSLI